MTTLIVISLVSLATLAVFVSRKTALLRAGELVPHEGEQIYNVIEPHVELVKHGGMAIFEELEHHFYKSSFVVLKNFTRWFSKTTSAIEKKLLELIHRVRGRGVIKQKGSASLFLEHLAAHRAKIRRETKI